MQIFTRILLVSLFLGSPPVWSAGPAEASPDYSAQTATDPEVPVDQLELMVRPLSLGELEIEAGAWLRRVRSKVEQVTAHEIDVKKKTAEIRQAEEGVNAGEEPQEAVETSQEKTEVLDELSELRDERASLIGRLNVVLDALKAKGGEVELYHKYADAVTGITIDVFDTKSTSASIVGWLTSEEGGRRVGWNLLVGVATLVGFWLLSIVAGRVTDRLAEASETMSQLLQEFLGKMARRLVLLIGLLTALAALELNISPLLAAIGGAAFVIAFALQGTLSNFASGVLILAYRPFDVADIVSAGGVEGKVDSMNLVSTHIRTFDNKLMIVPNNKVWDDVITNATGSEQRRVDLVFGIGYGDDIDKAQKIMEEIVAGHELTLDDPEPVIRVHELADSSVNFVCRPWVKTDDYWAVYWDVTRAVKEEFDRKGISIPFPQRDVHLHRAAPAAT